MRDCSRNLQHTGDREFFSLEQWVPSAFATFGLTAASWTALSTFVSELWPNVDSFAVAVSFIDLLWLLLVSMVLIRGFALHKIYVSKGKLHAFNIMRTGKDHKPTNELDFARSLKGRS